MSVWDYIGLGIVVLLLLDTLRLIRLNRRTERLIRAERELNRRTERLIRAERELNRRTERLIRAERERIRRDLARRA